MPGFDVTRSRARLVAQCQATTHSLIDRRQPKPTKLKGYPEGLSGDTTKPAHARTLQVAAFHDRADNAASVVYEGVYS